MSENEIRVSITEADLRNKPRYEFLYQMVSTYIYPRPNFLKNSAWICTNKHWPKERMILNVLSNL